MSQEPKGSQKVVIETLPGPLFVAAGAGSGKTYTLKLRTAKAFVGSKDGFKLDSINQVLAITFTEKAAAELLSRIKATLLEQGFAEQAFDADTAWISTIHGFCSRFLKETALEIGLDPEFKVADGLEASEIEAQAREAVLASIGEGQPDLSPILWNWDVVASGGFGMSLLDCADRLNSKLNAMPAMSGAFKHLEAGSSPKELMEGMIHISNALLQVALSWDKRNKNTEEKSVMRLPDAIMAAEEWIKGSQAELRFESPSFDHQGYLDVLLAFPILPPTFGAKKEGQDVIARYRQAAVRAFFGSYGSLGVLTAERVLELANMLRAERTRLMREAGLLSNDDLLRLTLAALEEHPKIAERYRSKFRLIMVDEFQDTDKVQLEIIRAISDPGFSNVCVVGDAQQSIYRFRGADVSVFTEFRDTLRRIYPEKDEESLEPKLSINFRSHSDILKLVDAVFEQEGSFGKDYLQLEPDGDVATEVDAVLDARPRITLDLMHYKQRDGIKRGPDALRKSAQLIARHFAELKRAYREAGNEEQHTYALLLGSTSRAQVYMDAFREEGLESMMTSGSTLFQSDEALVVSTLLRYASNPKDGRALLECLTSDLFSVSDDLLLALSHYEKDGLIHHGSLVSGFTGSSLPPGIPDGGSDAEALQMARQLLSGFQKRARKGHPSVAIKHLLAESGTLDRAQAKGVQGLAMVGNYSVLLNALEGVEKEHFGLSEIVTAYEAVASSAKMSPGVLAVAGSDFVQIMTMHGSKGLQFDHVALAEIKTTGSTSSAFIAENQGDHTYAISQKGDAKLDYLSSTVEEMMSANGVKRLEDARSAGELKCLLSKVSKEEELAEARRLLYVGLTRAVRSLYVSYFSKNQPVAKKKDAIPYDSQGVMSEVYQALQWQIGDEFEGKDQLVEYGGSAPACVRYHIFDKPDAEAGTSAPSSEGFLVPIRNIPDEPALARFRGVRSDVRSYSSLSHDAEPEEVEVAEEGAQDASSILKREPGEDPTALGTAFHRLAQLAILKLAPGEALSCPDDAAVRAQEAGLGLSDAQKERLARALGGWFGSPEAAELAGHEDVQAEVPFMVRIDAPDGQVRYLEGEIDALAASGSAAFLIDYKTGGSASESEETLHEKHLLQAQCYAYALLRNGYSSVDAVFVRVEQLDAAGLPQTVRYSFAADDLPALEAAILARWS